VLILFVALLFTQQVKETNPLKIIVNAGITLHQEIVSSAQGDVCNFTPSCSRFGRKAVNKYGIIWGSLMTADRLMRCNPWAIDHLNTYYCGIRDGRIYDPIENNYIFEKRRITDTTLLSLRGTK
jgi:putative component of membrane protein insertase Oxa1/YidC/SpoIIIJ protein YidD